jgi:hypothetical protein
MYEPHASKELNHAFAAHPFQGTEPEKANYLFIGLDANYGKYIDKEPIFPRVLEYLSDGDPTPPPGTQPTHFSGRA